MFFSISLVLYDEFTIEEQSSLPSCLFPILIVGILNEGISIIPLDEFPITASTLLTMEK